MKKSPPAPPTVQRLTGKLPLHDLTASELQELGLIAKSQVRRYWFPKRLEASFQTHLRTVSRDASLLQIVLTVLLFATAPVWTTLALNSPTQILGTAHIIELGLMTPLFVFLGFVQWRYASEAWVEWMFLGAFLLEVVCIELLRYQSGNAGYPIEPELTLIVPITVMILAHPGLDRAALFIVAYFGILLVKSAYWPDPLRPRTTTEWLLEILLLGLALLSTSTTRLLLRRQWASNILMELSTLRDHLTGLPNRRALEEHYDLAVRALSRTSKRRMMFALIDLDHFKKINDLYGHQHGDGVLAEFAMTLADYSRRALDISARVGGEEFALLLFDCDMAHATSRLHALLKSVRDLAIEHEGNEPGVVTCSIGAVMVEPGTPLAEAYHAADELLYQIKSSGRNYFRIGEIQRT
ncbi:MAG TPA: GGDEF domain-containing protein [Stenotrophobium sp.]|jgi:diguanylate cyclase (GGDEF)-like protein|nr:GGDEF domain-containing protein [Stenotrophobium sp.]